MVRQIYYRGSLDFCNYSCPYCPFSRKKASTRQLERDQEEWFRFIRKIEECGFSGAVQVVPYGEAMIHEHYWEGLAKLSKCGGIQAVGAQSNLSFPVEKMLDIYESYGGNKEKLRLWGTFHPAMISVDRFLEQCSCIQEAGVQFCVGSVGVPENIRILHELRQRLDSRIYMWVNKMDGLGRRYREDEIQAFASIDDHFGLELRHFQPDVRECSGALTVEGDGSIRSCILCHQKMGNLYRDGLDGLPEKKCTRRACDCFLAYGSRKDISELDVFQPFPAFRIPSCQ